jgi:hypothetical protein
MITEIATGDADEELAAQIGDGLVGDRVGCHGIQAQLAADGVREIREQGVDSAD